MSDFMKGLFPDTSKETGVNLENTENNLIINEAVVLDMVGGDTKAFNTILESVGKFAARDGILAEDANFDCANAAFANSTCSDCAAILTVAKEAGSKDYDLYIKALMLMKACLKNMKNQFSDIANKRLEAQKADVTGNVRVMEAVNSAESCCN